MALTARERSTALAGAQDLDTDIVVTPPSALFAAGVNASGDTRVARARCLHGMLSAAGIASRLDIVPGAMHSAAHIQLAVDAFFRCVSDAAAPPSR